MYRLRSKDPTDLERSINYFTDKLRISMIDNPLKNFIFHNIFAYKEIEQIVVTIGLKDNYE